MPVFIIERHIPGASKLTSEELRDVSAKSNEVVAGLGEPYTWITSYVAGDTVYCVHEAKDAETIRRHATTCGLPADKITEVAAIIGPETGKKK